MAQGLALHRIHRVDLSPRWYSTDGSGRFDLVGRARGTCYLADELLGSFVEVFRDPGLVARSLVDAKRANVLVVSHDLLLADCTSGAARQFGVTGAIHSTEDYVKTQAWATAFDEAGFDGIRYLVSHDPRQILVGVALFGVSNSDNGSPGTIPADVIDNAERIFGITVRPT